MEESVASDEIRAHLHRVSFVHGFQVDLDLGEHVLPPPLLSAPSSAAAKPERLPEDVKGVAPSTSAMLPLFQPFLAEAIVGLALFGVGEDLVGARDVEELGFGLVRVVLVGVCGRYRFLSVLVTWFLCPL